MTHACSIKAAIAVKSYSSSSSSSSKLSIERKKEKGRSHNKISTDHYHETRITMIIHFSMCVRLNTLKGCPGAGLAIKCQFVHFVQK